MFPQRHCKSISNSTNGDSAYLTEISFKDTLTDKLNILCHYSRLLVTLMPN